VEFITIFVRLSNCFTCFTQTKPPIVETVSGHLGPAIVSFRCCLRHTIGADVSSEKHDIPYSGFLEKLMPTERVIGAAFDLFLSLIFGMVS
jgi:hypothetical protein